MLREEGDLQGSEKNLKRALELGRGDTSPFSVREIVFG